MIVTYYYLDTSKPGYLICTIEMPEYFLSVT